MGEPVFDTQNALHPDHTTNSIYTSGLVSKDTRLRIDYTRRPEEDQVKNVIIEGLTPEDLENEHVQLVSKMLGEQYSAIAAVLGLNLQQDNYDFCVKDTGKDFGGRFIPPEENERGQVIVSKQYFDAIFSELSKKNLVIISGLVNNTIRILAHELYHRRQYEKFPDSFNRRTVTYIDYVTDAQGYEKQLLEKGPNLFSEEYVYKHLIVTQSMKKLLEMIAVGPKVNDNIDFIYTKYK